MKLFLIALLVLLPFAANAYIDPGSGSAIMSAIIGFFVALGIAIKTYWYKLKSLFTGSKKKSGVQSDNQTEEE
jgi:hypothetical protein